MIKKLNAIVDPVSPGVWLVTVTDVDSGVETILTINAATEDDAARKAMEQVNE